MSVKEEVEHDIWWQLKFGNSIFFFDNWTKQGALYFLEENIIEEGEIEMTWFIKNREWDKQILLESIFKEMKKHIIKNISLNLVGMSMIILGGWLILVDFSQSNRHIES